MSFLFELTHTGTDSFQGWLVLISREHDEILHRLSIIFLRDGDDALRDTVQSFVELTHDIARDAESFENVFEKSGVKI
jgi:hypothetical protein